jgi:hypothetical protein
MTNQTAVRKTGISVVVAAMGLLFATAHADAQLGGLMDKAKGAATSAGKEKAEKDVNAKLLAEGRKNQCSFKTDSDQLMPGWTPRSEAGRRPGRREEAADGRVKSWDSRFRDTPTRAARPITKDCPTSARQ